MERYKRCILNSFFIVILATLDVLILMRLYHIGQLRISPVIIGVTGLLILYLLLVCVYGIQKANKLCWTYQSAAIVLMTVSVGMSFMKISGSVDKSFFNLVKWSEEFSTSIKPSLRSFIFACFLVPAYFVKNKIHILKNWLSYVILALDLLFVSSFVNVLFNNNPWPIPFVSLDDQTFLIVAVILVWAGMKQISLYVFAAVLILGLMRMVNLEAVWGFNGVLFLLFAFLSLTVQFVNNRSKLTIVSKTKEIEENKTKEYKLENHGIVEINENKLNLNKEDFYRREKAEVSEEEKI